MKLSPNNLRLIRSALRLYASETNVAAGVPGSGGCRSERAKWIKARDQALRLVDSITLRLRQRKPTLIEDILSKTPKGRKALRKAKETQ